MRISDWSSDVCSSDLPPALLEDDDLLALRLRDDLGRNRKVLGVLEVRAFARQQDVVQRDGVAGVARQLLDYDLVSGGDAILLAAPAHDCEHRFIHLTSILTPWECSRARGPTTPKR